jgi:predicted Zn-dependent protease
MTIRPLALAVALLLAALATASSPTPGRADDHRADLEVGKHLYDDSVASDLIVDDSPYLAILKSVGARIVRASGHQWFSERFYVVRGSQLNAISAPGGYVFVNEGLLRTADNVDELANVLGHETAHLVLGHTMAKRVQEQRKDLLFKIGHAFVKDDSKGSQATYSVATSAGTYTFLNYSRQQEYAADQYGAQLAAKAGFNPYGSVWYCQNVVKLEGDLGTFEPYVRQHPSNSDRIARLKTFITHNPQLFAKWKNVMPSTSGLPRVAARE